jgi:mono/diheme cytochrome c family protein
MGIPMADGTTVMTGLRWAGMVLVLAATTAACSPMDDLIVSIFGRSMRSQISILPYEQEPLRPAEGSVPFASGNFPGAEGEVNLGQPEGVPMPPPITPMMVLQAMGQPDAVPEITGLVNPVQPTAASLERGELMYNRYCAPCHAESGNGQGPVTQAGIPPWSVVAPHVANYSDGFLYSIIRVGRGLMPGYGHQLTHFDRWHVVNYVRQLQGGLPQAPAGGESGAAGQD